MINRRSFLVNSLVLGATGTEDTADGPDRYTRTIGIMLPEGPPTDGARDTAARHLRSPHADQAGI